MRTKVLSDNNIDLIVGLLIIRKTEVERWTVRVPEIEREMQELIDYLQEEG